MAAFGWVAISAGWVEAEQADPAPAIAPAPPSAAGAGGATVADADTAIGRIYESAERGVALIEAERVERRRPSDPLESQAAAPPPARASSSTPRATC